MKAPSIITVIILSLMHLAIVTSISCSDTVAPRAGCQPVEELPTDADYYEFIDAGTDTIIYYIDGTRHKFVPCN